MHYNVVVILFRREGIENTEMLTIKVEKRQGERNKPKNE